MSCMQAIVRHLRKELMKISWGVLFVGRATALQLLLVGDAEFSALQAVLNACSKYLNMQAKAQKGAQGYGCIAVRA